MDQHRANAIRGDLEKEAELPAAEQPAEKGEQRVTVTDT